MLAILALIITIAVLTLINRPEEVKEGVADYNVKVIQGAVDLFHVDNSRYPADIDELYTNDNGPYLRTPKEELTKDGQTYIIDQVTGIVSLPGD